MSSDITPVSYRDILPAYPGYAIGNLIRKAALLKPELNDRLNRATDRLKIQLDKHAQIKEESKNNKEILEAKIYNSTAELNDTRKEINRLKDKITELNQQDDLLGPKFEETLPLNSASRMVIDSRSFASEKRNSLIVKREEKGRVETVIGNLISELFPEQIEKEMRPCLAPDKTLESFRKNVEQMLDKEGELSLIGSFITLSRVRRMDPIIIRPNAIGSKLKDNADQYYVLTEAVLGAVFLGVGSYVAGSRERGSSEEKKNQVRASASMISYISQGAIPRTSKKAEEVNLLTVYEQWKEVLIKDQDSGYPIGFRYRELQDVLRENGIQLNIRNVLSLHLQENEEKERSKQLLLDS